MSVYDLSRFIKTEVDLFNYPSLIMRIRNSSEYSRSGSTTYMFKRGDNIRLLAHKFYGAHEVWWAILDANPQYQSELEIKIGDILKIPSMREVASYV